MIAELFFSWISRVSCNKMWKISNNFGSRRFQDKPSTPFEPAWGDGLFWWKNSKKFPLSSNNIMETFSNFFIKRVRLPKPVRMVCFENLLGLKLFEFFAEFHCICAIFYGKTQITLVLEGFRTNQTYHSNRLEETDFFSEKIRKSFHYFSNNIMETFSNFFIKRVRLPKPVRMVCLVCPKTF